LKLENKNLGGSAMSMDSLGKGDMQDVPINFSPAGSKKPKVLFK
jgi:hypothetical protein